MPTTKMGRVETYKDNITEEYTAVIYEKREKKSIRDTKHDTFV